MKKNDLQFAVVREDPALELSLLAQFPIKKPLLIGSGGCTALALASAHPKMSLALIEPNPAQIKLIKEKIKVLKQSSRHPSWIRKLGVGESVEHSLIEGGNFESLFRSFRQFIFEFVADKKQIQGMFKKGSSKDWEKMFSHPYWKVAFDLFFHDSLLLAMFGPAAIQHAPSESYGRYFRAVIEKGLLRKDCSNNYFLHHIFLGHYLKGKANWPSFLQKPAREIKIKIFNCLAQDMGDYAPYDLVGLSNIFDWSSEEEIKSLALKLQKELKLGSFILYRQLNNGKDFKTFFGDSFEWLTDKARELKEKDRSLFYSSIHLARKIK